ncbi:MAG: low-specificity L-threonine aldolase [Theionarchaea archaeon]|nr:low-specificity L-threonine aldolase [Theionarchaea archaeon]
MRIVDLRSDTFTLPTEEMMKAIQEAELGDDVFQEDPTMNRLQKMAAEKVGKEKGLFVTSGTQGNVVSLLAHTQHGDEVILEAESHTYMYEVGAMAALGGLMARTIPGVKGALPPEEVKKAIRPENIHFPRTTLLCVENTHNNAGGTVITPQQIKDLADIAKPKNIKMHLDGARVFNAAIALHCDVKRITKEFDSVMFCFSKGLSAPVGSIVCGSEEFIEGARRVRKMLGGGMRQAGILAACGIVALEKMVDRLKDDHKNAQTLAEGLAEINEISIDLDTVQTNIIVFDVSRLGGSEKFIAALEKKGVKCLPRDENRIRMVTHRMVSAEDIDIALQRIREVV